MEHNGRIPEKSQVFYGHIFWVVKNEAPGMYKNNPIPIGHLRGGLHLSLPEPKVLELRKKSRCGAPQ